MAGKAMRHVESTLTRSKAKAAPYFQGDVKMLPSQVLSAGAGFQSFSSFALVANLGSEHEGQDSNCFWVVHDLFHQPYVYSIHMYMYLYTYKKQSKRQTYIYKYIHIYTNTNTYVHTNKIYICIYKLTYIYKYRNIYIYR